MNKDSIEAVFSSSLDNFPKCPECTRRGLAFVGDTVVCGFCDWTESLSTGGVMKTPLARWLKVKPLKLPFGDRRLQYLYRESGDDESRNQFLKRAFERASNLEEATRFRDLVLDFLLKLIRDPGFQTTFQGKGFPSELYLALHSRNYLPSADQTGAIVMTPQGDFFELGDPLLVPTRPYGLEMAQEEHTAEALAQAGSWDFLGDKGGVFSSVVHMRPLKDGELGEAKGEVDEAVGPDGRVFVVTYLTYNFYPRSFLVGFSGLNALDPANVAIVGSKTCLNVSHRVILQPDKSLWAYYDKVLIQPVLWSAVHVSRGDGSGDFCPRYFSVLGCKECSITACVSESLTDGSMVARAAIRDNTKNFPSISLKTIDGQTAEECIDRVRKRMKDYAFESQSPVVAEKEWDVLEMDPYVALFEMRNLWIWKDSRALSGILRRKPTAA